MLQIVDGRQVYVVDFDAMPELPITGVGEEIPFARALTAAIESGLISEPGKYGIEVVEEHGRLDYTIFAIVE